MILWRGVGNDYCLAKQEVPAGKILRLKDWAWWGHTPFESGDRPLTLRDAPMPQSLANLLVHLVFSTKHRIPWLRSPEIREGMHAYLVGVCREASSPTVLVNSVEDHLHRLCRPGRTISVSELIQQLKTASSLWIKKQSAEYADFQWQGGYGAFSVSQSSLERVKEYISRQEEHHRQTSFQDEFRSLLKKHGVEFDER